MHATPLPKSNSDALHRNRKTLQRAVYTFFLVLIQERTKENQGRKARPDGCPAGGTATRYYSPRLWRGSFGIAYLAHRHVPPPTHCRVRLLCLCLLLPLHSPSGKRAGVRLYPTSNEQRATYTNDFICHPEHSEGSQIDPMRCFACAQHDNSFTNNQQRFQPRRGVIFVTPWLFPLA